MVSRVTELETAKGHRCRHGYNFYSDSQVASILPSMGYAFFSNCLAMGCHFSKHISTRCTFMISAGGSKNSKICKLTRCVSYETISYYKMILCIHFFPMMQKLVATKCNSTIFNFRKIRHKTTLGYRQGLNIPI